MSPRKPAYVGLECINIDAIESAPGVLTSLTVRTGCDRYANRIMEIWGILVDIIQHDFIANTLVTHFWTLSTDPAKTATPHFAQRDAVLGGMKSLRFNATFNDPWVITMGGFYGAHMLTVPIEVADDELYLWYQTTNGTALEGLRVKLYIKYKEVSKEHYLDVLETFR